MGRRLQDARRRAHLSQRQLADALCSASYISRVESGARIPSLQLVRALAARLSVPEGYLSMGARPSTDASRSSTGLTQARLPRSHNFSAIEDLTDCLARAQELLADILTMERERAGL